MGLMTTPDFWSGQDRTLTVEDMENMPDDEFRYELDDGVLIVSPAPPNLHQLAVTRLAVRLSSACPVRFEVLAGVFQEIPPALVVEVASPRTRLYDRNRKKDIYEGFGIPAYWIVETDMDRPELIVFELREGVYKQTAHVAGSEEYHAEIPFPVTITPSQLVSLHR
jgi:Uma2 family endonuclease